MKKIPKRGDRVKVVSLNMKGTVHYVDGSLITAQFFYPIQVELDKPYCGSGSPQRMYRTSLDDLKRLVKKKRVKR